MDFHASVWPLELGWKNATLWCGPRIWSAALQLFGVAPGVRVVQSNVFVWPLNSG